MISTKSNGCAGPEIVYSFEMPKEHIESVSHVSEQKSGK